MAGTKAPPNIVVAPYKDCPRVAGSLSTADSSGLPMCRVG